MRLRYHIIVTSILSLVFLYITNSITGSLLLLAFGFLLDFDHLLDFWILQKKITFRNLELSDEFYRYKKVYIILHSYELFPVFLFIGFKFLNYATVGVLVGYFSHMVTDIIGNYFIYSNPLVYSIIYRYNKKFDHFTLCPYKYQDAKISKNK